MSVWETVDALKQYVYRSAHAQLLRERYQWFEKFAGTFVGLWWVPKEHLPTVEEATEHLEYLEAREATPFAFTFGQLFPPPASPDSVIAGTIPEPPS
jgi:Domain of unknown function (DUF3291)